MAKKVYAIKEGFDTKNNKKIENIIVETWAECLLYVKGVKGAKYKSFEDLNAAKEYLTENNCPLKKEDNNYPMDCLHIYVDGSYNIASEEYSYGVVVVYNDIIVNIESGKGKIDSNNNIRQIAGELEGAVKGVEYALSRGEERAVIFHDYVGICYHATGIWDRKEESSKKYYEKMQKMMSKGIEIVFVKVDSHTGDLYNELVDEKCKEQLGINSDKVILKWLKNNQIRVVDQKVKQEVSSLAHEFEHNIIIENIDMKNNEITSSQDIIDKVNSLMIELTYEKQKNVLEYILKINGTIMK